MKIRLIQKLLLLFLFLLIVSTISCKKDDESTSQINANFSASELNVIEGSSIIFTDQSTNNPTQWDWTFEGGTPLQSSERNPTVLYDTPGVYEVSLTASNSESSDTEVKSEFITVYQRQEAQFSVSDSIINQNSEVTFTDVSVGSPTS